VNDTVSLPPVPGVGFDTMALQLAAAGGLVVAVVVGGDVALLVVDCARVVNAALVCGATVVWPPLVVVEPVVAVFVELEQPVARIIAKTPGRSSARVAHRFELLMCRTSRALFRAPAASHSRTEAPLKVLKMFSA
jgi:hypothetical protein